ncbi:TRAP transporter large permease [Flaviflexus massiliensis]|uniref:TRAP transporter large permease n=1 Tax=Flaviflexus massiliensis TaxID=1522309 RepID=UPI0006D59CC7|nr:TRAP transporter large permease [Flaviflexus massiliensis]
MSVGIVIAVLFGVFAVLLFMGAPISISIVVSSLVTTLFTLPWDQATFIIMQKMNNGLDSFSLLAVPLFILAGNIMNNGGIARRLINLALVIAGRIPGSLAQTNVVGNMLFGALSGSAVAAAAAIGGTMQKMEREQGYNRGFGAAVNVASAPAGLLIPPTTAFIVYSTIAGGVSISALFMAGVIPGILLGAVSMIIAFVYAKKEKYPTSERVTASVALKTFVDAIPSLLLIVVVVGGIAAGIFTATEGAGIAVLYCLILSIIYRTINLEVLKKMLMTTAGTSGMILFLIAGSGAMSWVMAFTGIPGAIADAILSVSDNQLVIFLLMNVILLVVGMFLDITPAILIFTPIFLPIATSLGMDPVHFGVVLVLNMCIGTMTPPVGSVLFVSIGVFRTTMEEVVAKLWPFLIGAIVLLLVITYAAPLSMWLPGVMGLL